MAKFLFDECIAIKAFHSLKSFIELDRAQNVEIEYLPARFGHGKMDEEWVPIVAREGSTIISADRGVGKSRGAGLPLLCERYKIRHVLLSSTLHQMKAADKQRIIIQSWPLIRFVADQPAGAGFLLRLTGEQRTLPRTMLQSLKTGERVLLADTTKNLPHDDND